MLELEKINPAKTKEYINAIYSRRAAFFNFFGQQFEENNQFFEENDRYFETNDSFVLAKSVRNFHRIYAASNNKKELIKILSSLKGINVINIPAKGDIQDIETIMAESGYEQISVFERFRLNVKDLEYAGDTTTIALASTQDEEEIHNLYSSWESFNPYVDWLPTRDELKDYIENKVVLINKIDNKVVGANFFSLDGKSFKWRLLIDLSGNAIKLMSVMFDMLRKNEVKHFRFFINSLNEKSIKFHLRLGAVPDGLKDYTYIKR